MTTPTDRDAVERLIPCPCTSYEQDETCPVGFPSQICWACGGMGHTTIEKVAQLAAEMMRIADQVGETEYPFAAWESLASPTPTDALERAIEAEREACAKVADALAAKWASEYKSRASELCGSSHREGMSDGADDIAAAIRARSDAQTGV